MKNAMEFVWAFLILIISACGTYLVVHTPNPTVPSTQTSAIVATATLEPTKIPPTKVVTATVEPTLIPAQIPSTIHAPTVQLGWNTYVNDYLGYQFNYPPSMRVHAEGFMSMGTNQPIPPGFTSDEYFTYLENIFPNNLCMLVESDAGMIAIAPPADSIGSFVVPCPGMGIGEQYRFEDTSQTFLVNGKQLQIPGKRMYLENTGEFHNDLYMFNLDNKFGIVFISGPAKGQPFESYPEKNGIVKAGPLNAILDAHPRPHNSWHHMCREIHSTLAGRLGASCAR